MSILGTSCLSNFAYYFCIKKKNQTPQRKTTRRPFKIKAKTKNPKGGLSTSFRRGRYVTLALVISSNSFEEGLEVGSSVRASDAAGNGCLRAALNQFAQLDAPFTIKFLHFHGLSGRGALTTMPQS